MAPNKQINSTARTCLASTNAHVTLQTYQQSLNDGVPVLAFVVHHLNVIQVSVSPVHQLADQVQSDAMREDDFTVYQFGAVLAIHITALHLRDLAVVCEEHFPGKEEKINFMI